MKSPANLMEDLVSESAIQQTSLWKHSFESDTYSASQEAANRLRQGFTDMRIKARLLANEIARDLPDFTGHDIDHIDSIWETADTLAGQSVELNPAAAFVYGAAALTHDLAMSRAAYVVLGEGLRTQPEWPDRLASKLRQEYGRPPHPFELVQPPEELAKSAENGMLRELHAKQAENLPLGHWRGLDGSEHYLISDSDLRSTFGRLIGRLAASHHWPRDIAVKEFSKFVGAPAFAPAGWKVDPLLIACMLRTADAAHLDASRAPDILAAVRGVAGSSRDHWIFQHKMQKPYLENGKLIFTAPAGFSDEEIDAWWLAFDMIRIVDEELRGVDSILAASGRPRLSANAVVGADSPRSFGELAECIGWEPVETHVQVTDVAGLVRRLGGTELYGQDSLAPLREILANACDAVKAREALQNYRGGHFGQSHVRISLESAEDEIWLEIRDNGIGMSPEVMSGPLLDFGCSSWLSPTVTRENPGLLASRFAPTGRFGIGFFSVFMLGNRVRVVSRSLSAARESTWILDFGSGLDRRPTLRIAKTTEVLDEPGTLIQVLLDGDLLDEEGRLTFEVERTFDEHVFTSIAGGSLARIVRYVMPAPEANIWVKERSSGQAVQIMAANDWTAVDGETLLYRILGGWADVDEMTEDNSDRKLVSVVKRYGSMLENIANPDGTVVARICAVDEIAISVIGWAGPQLSCVTAGAARTATGAFGIVGLMLGSPTRAARDSALPVISTERIAEWASQEVQKVETRHLDRRQLWWIETFAEAMRVLGGSYESLPFWKVCQDRLNEEELRHWLRSRNDIYVVHPVHKLIRVGMTDQYADPISGTIWFEDGSRPALRNATRRWPLPNADETLDPGTLFERAVSDAWGISLGTVAAYRKKLEAVIVKVAEHDGKDIVGEAEHLVRSDLVEADASTEEHVSVQERRQ
ncbi:HD domain-containing protein [Micromonospora rubida]|uniref:HD domain-containing protein n=1 Tax=Micromonospora rubida TaxID=2697657 RepID=UPI001378C417|nr:ATP-binding protein [Micromonospora rubida]NBE80878.1 hypothetical protein [Micromonospora rubida]